MRKLAAQMGCCQDNFDSRVSLALDKSETWVKHLGENEQAKRRSHYLENDIEHYLGNLQLVVCPLNTSINL